MARRLGEGLGLQGIIEDHPQKAPPPVIALFFSFSRTARLIVVYFSLYISLFLFPSTLVWLLSSFNLNGWCRKIRCAHFNCWKNSFSSNTPPQRDSYPKTYSHVYLDIPLLPQTQYVPNRTHRSPFWGTTNNYPDEKHEAMSFYF